MAKKDRAFWESAKYNNATFNQYYNRLMELAMSMFEWKNLPDTVDERFLELSLFSTGMAVFFQDDVLGFLGLRCVIGGLWNVYQIPTKRRAIASNGYQHELDENNSVIIFNNLVHTTTLPDVELFAHKLYQIDRIIEINANAQKTPILITCDENEMLTMKNLYMKYDGNQPVIFGRKSIRPDAISSINTGAPFIGLNLYQLKTQIWNEALTFLGISNVNYSKKERLISDEVIRNQGGTIASRYSRLEARRQACREINRMFDLDIWCDYREDFQLLANATDTVIGEPSTDGQGGDAEKQGVEE